MIPTRLREGRRTTKFDRKLSALDAIMAEWGRTDVDYNLRLLGSQNLEEKTHGAEGAYGLSAPRGRHHIARGVSPEMQREPRNAA